MKFESRLELGEKHLHEATSYIQELITDPVSDTGLDFNDLETILHRAKAGQPGCDQKVQDIIVKLMETYGLTITDMDNRDAAKEIYKYLWGLDVIEDIYKSPNIDEIRVNSPDKVYYQDKGRNMKADVSFKDNEHVNKIITRMLEHDRASLDESNPGCESRRLDGTRITALGPPVVKNPSMVLRRHGTFNISDDNYIKSSTMDKYTMQLLATLVKGRANILIAGDSNTGKTTLLRWLAKFMRTNLRVVTIETDRELLLDEWYPDRDITAIEAHPEINWDIRRCFTVTLRLSPNVIIVGEARGVGEAGQMINACRSGHHGSMGTIHVFSVYEAVSILAQMALEEGRKLPISILENQVAASFDVILQMYGSDVTGTRKIEHITEVFKGKDGPEFNDLCIWKPSEESYEKGVWEYPNPISPTLAAKLFKYGVTKKELLTLERMRKHAA